MESGKKRPAETWDFGFGDVWYFRSNEGHTIQGLQDGCTYLAGAPTVFKKTEEITSWGAL